MTVTKTCFREYPIMWRGEEWIASARIDGRKTSIAWLSKLDGRESLKTFVAMPEDQDDDVGGGEHQKATALSALTPEERLELFKLVRAATPR